MPTFSLLLNDVVEIQMVGLALQQVVEVRFDAVIGGGGVASSQDLLTQFTADVGPMVALLSAELTNTALVVRKITDAIIPLSGIPRRVYGLKDFKVGQAVLDGGTPGAALSPDLTMSIYLATNTPGRIGHGRKGFGPIPAGQVNTDGSHVAAASSLAWGIATTGYFTAPHNIGATGATYRPGLFSTTNYARRPAVKPPVTIDLYNIVQTFVGLHIGTQLSRKANPQDIRF